MTEPRYNQALVNEYRKTAIELHELRQKVEQQLDAAIESGDKQVARSALDQLKASGEAFKELRNTLSPTDLFIAKYNIQIHGPHEVSFVLPKEASRYEMLCEAQALVAERDNRDLVWPNQLRKWKDDKTFQASCVKPERIHIDGHVEGGDGKTRADQETLLRGKEFPQVNLEDLAAAFVAFYVATGQDLFEDILVRVAGGTISFYICGLRVRGDGDGISRSYGAAASRVPRPSPRLRTASRNSKN